MSDDDADSKTQNKLDTENCSVEVGESLKKYRCFLQPVFGVVRTQAGWMSVVRGIEVEKLPTNLALPGGPGDPFAQEKTKAIADALRRNGNLNP